MPLDQNPVVSKVPEFFNSNVKPNILLLGSSLPMTAVARWDAQFARSLDSSTLEAVRTYTQALYLEHLLAKRFGKPVKVFNLTCVAMMASEARLILTRAIDAGKAPQMVVYGVAPRDFIDNTVPPLGKTPVYEVLADWRCLNDLISRHLTPEEIQNTLISYAWYFFKVKADYRTLLTLLACDSLGRSPTLYAALLEKPKPGASTESTVGSTLPEQSEFGETSTATPQSSLAENAAFHRDLANYQARYNPPNFSRFAEELQEFRRLLALARTHHITVVVVNMPLTTENRALIPADLHSKYHQDVLSLPARYGHTLVNLQAKDTFNRADFSDSVHTNARGGKKVQDLLIGSLAENGTI